MNWKISDFVNGHIFTRITIVNIALSHMMTFTWKNFFGLIAFPVPMVSIVTLNVCWVPPRKGFYLAWK